VAHAEVALLVAQHGEDAGASVGQLHSTSVFDQGGHSKRMGSSVSHIEPFFGH